MMAPGPHHGGTGPHGPPAGPPLDPRENAPAAPGTPFPPFFGWPVPGGAGHRHGPRVKRGDVRAAILALLVEAPHNGYQIIQEIAERSQGIWKPSPGSVYPALQQLEDEGLVRAREDGGRRMYRLTGEGRRYVRDRPGEAAAPWVAVAESVTEELVDVRVLMGQVGMALQQVARAGSPGQLAEAGRVLTDTRRALYRILAEDGPYPGARGEPGAAERAAQEAGEGDGK